MTSGTLRHLLLLIALLSTVSVAAADSWAPPETSQYTSSNGIFRLTVEPRALHSTHAFLQDSFQGVGVGSAGQASGQPTKCTGTLERKQQDGTHETIWAATLRNSVSPVDAIVSNSGRFVVTFDNWHSMGFGKDVVAIYSSDGGLIRELSLLDFLSQTEIAKSPQSVSSIWWGRGHYFDPGERFLVLRVAEGPSLPLGADATFREIKIALPAASVARPESVLEELAGQSARCKAIGAATNSPQTCVEQENDPTWCAVCLSVAKQIF